MRSSRWRAAATDFTTFVSFLWSTRHRPLSLSILSIIQVWIFREGLHIQRWKRRCKSRFIFTGIPQNFHRFLWPRCFPYETFPSLITPQSAYHVDKWSVSKSEWLGKIKRMWYSGGFQGASLRSSAPLIKSMQKWPFVPKILFQQHMYPCIPMQAIFVWA